MWFNSHGTLLELQFTLVGDDGTKNIEDIQEPMTKESENIFTFWCSGHISREGILVELKLLKRQDLVGVISSQLVIRSTFVLTWVMKTWTVSSSAFPTRRIPSASTIRNERFKHLLLREAPGGQVQHPRQLLHHPLLWPVPGPKPMDDQQPLELPVLVGKQVLISVFNILNKDKMMEEAIALRTWSPSCCSSSTV